MDAIRAAAEQASSAIQETLGTDPPPPVDAYLAWNAPGVENVRPDEEEKSKQIAATMRQMQGHNLDQHRHCFRATHVKTQAIVKGELVVPADLPTHLRQGIFGTGNMSTEKRYPVAARYANEPVWLQPDQAPGPRGMGLRVFGIDAVRAGGGVETTSTQDFFFNNAPMLELTDIDTTLEIMQLRARHFDMPGTTLPAALATRTDALKQRAPTTLPNTNIIGMNMYTQSAFRFGVYYGHMGLFPAEDSMHAHHAGEDVSSSLNPLVSAPASSSPIVLSDWLADYFSQHKARYKIKIQLGTSPALHPTEDASVVWDEKTAPWQEIGTLVFPPQSNVMSPERRTKWEDGMFLDPWRGLDAHQPLGGVNRLRKWVYEASRRCREEANASALEDVLSVDDIP